MDGLLQPRIGGLYHGVSRQAPLLRSPSQMQELDNFLPSVDIGGWVDRSGTTGIAALNPALYAPGNHHFFRTTDGQRWVVLKRAENGALEVRNLVNGALASLSYGPYVQNYIGSSQKLKFLSIADTTLILNPAVVSQVAVPPVPALESCYVVVKKLSTAAQTFTVLSSRGTATWVLQANQGNLVTRDFVAMALTNTIVANMPGVNAFRVAGNVIKVSAPADVIASLTASNDWDEAATLCIKGRVTALTDLPPTFESGVPILVDLGQGEAKSAYYVRYDTAKNAWVECSYLPNSATTAALSAGTMPVRLHQLGANSFELQPCDWAPRKVGDDESNAHPGFVGKPITAMAQWKGRLWLAATDTVYSSQPDDLFNFYRASAREVRPADPVTLPADTPDVGSVQHLVAFRNKLMVMCDTAQLEIPGEKPITPTDAVIGVATRYQLNDGCEPRVIGDALYFAGQTEGRSTLWEYSYDDGSANNVGEDLSKHIPGYVPGRVTRIRGSAQAGRHYSWTSADPATLFVHTGYFKDSQRAQNAWSKLTFPNVTAIQEFWVYEGTLYLLALGAGSLWLLSVPVEADLGSTPRVDLQQAVQITWNAARNRSEVMLPSGYQVLPGLFLQVGNRAYNLTTVWDGTQWLAHFASKLTEGFGVLGVRYTRRATFSPFYATLGDDKPTPLGRLQVRNVVIDALVAGDFTATITRADRVQQTYQRSPRVVGEALVPDIGFNTQHRIPFNSKGDAAELTLSSTSHAPMAITGFTLMGRYTNPFAQ
ncbi:phage nozzle protein [Variovorax paradoxus]|uniref:phage nozzle protein n=1 Tax=Variovorax paradoxus TaxID=34073 RepID=UPI00285FF401|nr:hypothetical protein [Variovorax paradoxus]MDR6455500.1 hypothetical protein [Variovorax paradoxus]